MLGSASWGVEAGGEAETLVVLNQGFFGVPVCLLASIRQTGGVLSGSSAGKDIPVCCDDSVSERIDALAFWLLLDLWVAGAVLLLLEFAAHFGGWEMCIGWKKSGYVIGIEEEG